LKDLKDSPKPLIGFCGTIAGDLYISLIQYLCDRFPEYNFVLAGKNELAASRPQVAKVLDSFANLFFIDEIAYEQVPALINSFDVGLLPYFSLAKKRFPLKLFEYLACGKPVVASGLEELAPYHPQVLVSRSHGEFARHLEKALQFSKDMEFAAQARQMAAANDWQYKIRELHKIIEN
jgi:glycosyltransferase involved in cell wall biosynthesis